MAFDGPGLKRIREDAGLTREQLAVKAGMAGGHIFRLENGVTAKPTRNTVRAIAEALGVTVDALYAADGDEQATA